MIPYDSFLVDPPLLFGSGFLTGRLFGRRGRVARGVEAGTLAVFWATSVSLYLNLPWTRWIWEMVRADSGRDWMINSGVFRFEHRNPRPAVHALSAAILATYPVWLRLGVMAGAARRG